MDIEQLGIEQLREIVRRVPLSGDGELLLLGQTYWVVNYPVDFAAIVTGAGFEVAETDPPLFHTPIYAIAMRQSIFPGCNGSSGLVVSIDSKMKEFPTACFDAENCFVSREAALAKAKRLGVMDENRAV